MRLPRPRFTVRRLMVVVAIAAVCLEIGITLERRNSRFMKIADSYLYPDFGPSPTDCPIIKYKRRMRAKYIRAANYPWLPVPPDTE